jgi:DNA helicase-2/ATP-dependent DNA helicase PcrA
MEVLANRGKHLGIEKLPTIFELYQDRKQVLLQSVMRDPELQNVLTSAGDSRQQDRLIGRWLEMIGDFKNNLILPEMVEDDVGKSIYQGYSDELRASSALDFDDLLLFTYRLFVERPKIADFYRRQYLYICVDEAQDLNEAQYQIIRALCGPEYRNVMMVGDPRQAIFVWNGADPKYLDLFERDFHAKKVLMNENYRSAEAIVKAAQALDGNYHVAGQLPIRGNVKFIVAKDEKEEATRVLDYLQRLRDRGHEDIEGAVTLDRCALLGRTRYVLTPVEQEIKERRWAYYRHLSSQHESESDLLRHFELCLRVLANPRDRLHLGILLKNWKLDLGNADLSNFDTGLELLARLATAIHKPEQQVVLTAAREMEWSEQHVRLLAGLQCLEHFAEQKVSRGEERALILEDIKVWRQHWDAFLRSQSGGNQSLGSFLSQVALGETQQPRQEGLALLTVHSAKGLEFDVVALMGMAEGVFPDYRAQGAALEEEKRNAFVAVTRSKRLLILSYSETRVMPWGDVWQQKPSRYLEILQAAMAVGQP